MLVVHWGTPPADVRSGAPAAVAASAADIPMDNGPMPSTRKSLASFAVDGGALSVDDVVAGAETDDAVPVTVPVGAALGGRDGEPEQAPRTTSPAPSDATNARKRRIIDSLY